MAKKIINTGTTDNDGTGDSLKAGAGKVNDNFNEIYTAFGDGTTLTGGTLGGDREHRRTRGDLAAGGAEGARKRQGDTVEEQPRPTRQGDEALRGLGTRQPEGQFVADRSGTVC